MTYSLGWNYVPVVQLGIHLAKERPVRMYDR